MTKQKNAVQFIQFLPGIAWFLFASALICLPGKDMPDEPDWLKIPYLDKLVHAVLFGGIVYFFCRPFKNSAMANTARQHLFLKITLSTIIWGIATECLQKFFITGRQFDWVDWAADSTGAIVAFLVCKKFFLLPTSGQ